MLKLYRHYLLAMMGFVMWACVAWLPAQAPNVDQPYASDASTFDLFHFDYDALQGATWADIVDYAAPYRWGWTVNVTQADRYASGLPGLGTALKLDGVTARAEFPPANQALYDNALTVELWIRPDRVTGAVQTVAALGSAWRLYIQNGALCCFLNGRQAGTLTLQSTTAMRAGQWQHVAATWNGTTLRLFINGMAAGSVVGALTGGLDQATTGWLLLGCTASRTEPFGGLIDEVRLSATARTFDTQFFGFPYQALATRQGEIVGLYFDGQGEANWSANLLATPLRLNLQWGGKTLVKKSVAATDVQVTATGITLPEVAYAYTGDATATMGVQWTATVQDGQLQLQSLAHALGGTQLYDLNNAGHCFATAWAKTGYDVSNPSVAPFRTFISSLGQYLPIEQFKRMSWRTNLNATAWVRAQGQQGYDVTWSKPADVRFGMHWMMSAAQMDYRFYGYNAQASTGTLTTAGQTFALNWNIAPTQSVPEYFPQMQTVSNDLGSTVTRFYWERAFSWPDAPIDWKDWQTTIRAWNDSPLRERELRLLESTTQESNGYVWSWWDKAGWNFPDPTQSDNRHFTSNSNFVLGTWKLYAWSRNRGVLERLLPRCEQAMQFYIDQLNGGTGLLTVNLPGYGGTSSDWSTSYYDIQPLGYRNSYLNLYYASALQAMRELELAAGNETQAQYYGNLLAQARTAFDATFWRSELSRYVTAIDKNGVDHDYGNVVFNLDAFARGLGDVAKGETFLQWAEQVQTTSGAADVFTRWIFAPRTTAFRNSNWWVPMWQPLLPPWEGQVQDGGAFLFEAYYELVARQRLRGADDAWGRFTQILQRYNEPDKLCGGDPLYRGEKPQTVNLNQDINGGVGTDTPFPESGLVPTAFVDTFMGIQATTTGLEFRPALAGTQSRLSLNNLLYANVPLDVTVERNHWQASTTVLGYPFKWTGDVTGGVGRLPYATLLDGLKQTTLISKDNQLLLQIAAEQRGRQWTRFYDRSTNFHSVTPSRAELAMPQQDAHQGAWRLDGIDDSLRVAHSSALNVSNQFWARVRFCPERVNGIQRLLSKQGSFFLYLNGRRVEFYAFGLTPILVATGDLVNAGEWHEAIVELANGKISLWVDGRRLAGSNVSGTIQSSSNDLFIGAFNPYSDFFKGSLEDVTLRLTAPPPAVYSGVHNWDAYHSNEN